MNKTALNPTFGVHWQTRSFSRIHGFLGCCTV